MLRLRTLVIVAALASSLVGTTGYAEEKSIVVASTTSTEDSGLFSHILPLFKAKTGIAVKVLAQGTGRHSIPVVAGTPMSCSSTPSQPRKDSSPTGSA